MIAVGTRGSKLSIAQTMFALEKLRESVAFEHTVRVFSSPGDRDLETPIEQAAADFFTKDLDDAIRSGEIDCAIHSAKDLAYPLPDDLDWVWLPWREDPRDALVRLCNAHSAPKTIGTSSARRAAWMEKKFPGALAKPVRGAIDARLEQLAAGKFDAIVMALAGLNRLGADMARFHVEPIPLEELPPPEGQGILALVWKKGNGFFEELRWRFVKAVRFVSGGTGDAGNITVRGARDIEEADTVIADALAPQQNGAQNGKWIYAGKRCGRHSHAQSEITQMICDEARKGKRVARLKGGDATVYGRLAEETDALEELRLPFAVRPGVGAHSTAAAATGMLLTRRGEAAGFKVSTPRSSANAINEVAYMDAGGDGGTVVLDAGGLREEIKRRSAADDRPGVRFTGPCEKHRWAKNGLLRGMRVLVTASEDVQESVRLKVEDYGGTAVAMPLVKLQTVKCAIDVRGYDAIVFASPAAARCFFEAWSGDVRTLPLVWTCGRGTARALASRGIYADIVPEEASSEGLVASLPANLAGMRILRIASDKSTKTITDAMRMRGAAVDEKIIYTNTPISYNITPVFDAVHFASSSAVDAFLRNWPATLLAGKRIFAQGKPVLATLEKNTLEGEIL
ncbi:MAG: uroporphyrinogen-III synthase [Kiritimatiellae bacterium]|nr:uroporphyrinogen-III synthase [Kiritimatiellia bacterium]